MNGVVIDMPLAPAPAVANRRNSDRARQGNTGELGQGPTLCAYTRIPVYATQNNFAVLMMTAKKTINSRD